MDEYITKLIQRDLNEARDDLYRAKNAAESHDLHRRWGQSGQTLQEIINGYQLRIDQAEAALAKITRRT